MIVRSTLAHGFAAYPASGVLAQVKVLHTALLYIYVHTEPWQSVATTGQHRLTWEEGLALAEVIVSLRN